MHGYERLRKRLTSSAAASAVTSRSSRSIFSAVSAGVWVSVIPSVMIVEEVKARHGMPTDEVRSRLRSVAQFFATGGRCGDETIRS